MEAVEAQNQDARLPWCADFDARMPHSHRHIDLSPKGNGTEFHNTAKGIDKGEVAIHAIEMVLVLEGVPFCCRVCTVIFCLSKLDGDALLLFLPKFFMSPCSRFTKAT